MEVNQRQASIIDILYLIIDAIDITKVAEAIIQFARIKCIELCEVDLAVKASSMAIGGSTMWCDVCTRYFFTGSAYHHCSIWQNGNFDICLECFEIGAVCLNRSHKLVLHEPAVLQGKA